VGAHSHTTLPEQAGLLAQDHCPPRAFPVFITAGDIMRVTPSYSGGTASDFNRLPFSDLP